MTRAEQVRRAVAEAASEAWNAKLSYPSPSYSAANCPTQFRDDWNDIAGAAIVALLQCIEAPSEAMVRAGDDQVGDSTRAIWHAMLAQLKQEIGGT